MVNQRYRAIYLAALIVVCIGLLGTVLVPRAHTATWPKPAVAVATLEPTIQQRMLNSSRSLVEFASLGFLSSIGLALLYSKSRV